MKIPSLVLRQLYTSGSLENTGLGVTFDLKNRLSDAKLLRIAKVRINDGDVPLDRLTVHVGADRHLRAVDITPDRPLQFPLRQSVRIEADNGTLEIGKHSIELAFETQPFGILKFKVHDTIAKEKAHRTVVPCDKEANFSPEIVRRRHEFIREYTGVELDHVTKYSFDPQITQGNIENFTGVAQVPIGFAGPLKVNGEHIRGEEVLIPLATTEGTLVASYNRGIKTLNLSGGVTATVLYDSMQRAPVFVFDSAREAREFKTWVDDHFEEIRDAAEATSSVAKLKYIDPFHSNKFLYLRFNFSTGDAAGQNMVGRATFAACSWILDHVDSVRKFYLESNLATDKKSSQVNVMRTRGKRVVAEATIPRHVLMDTMRVEPESLIYHYNVANIGAFLSGANNNGAHSPNAITAMFIATGQDVANVAESAAGILYCEQTPHGDLYISLTIPSLIVATYGGGTALPTQRECLDVMGCSGKGKVNRLAEIIAGVALAGEISLGSAISSLDWVSSHEKYGRNR